MPDDARRLVRGHPRDRCRDRRLEHPVRRGSRDRPDDRHRDEPARVALVRARVQGDGVSDRQDRQPKLAVELRARRVEERHHPPYARQFRADDRLHRDEGAPVHLREVSRCRSHPDLLDEIRGRGDGDRADVQGVHPEGPALARDRGAGIRRRRQAGRRRAAGRRDHQDQAGDAQCRAHLLHPVRVQGGLHGRAGIRPDEDRPVVPCAPPARDPRDGG